MAVGSWVPQAIVLDSSDTEISTEGQQVLGGQVLQELAAETLEHAGVPLPAMRG